MLTYLLINFVCVVFCLHIYLCIMSGACGRQKQAADPLQLLMAVSCPQGAGNWAQSSGRLYSPLLTVLGMYLASGPCPACFYCYLGWMALEGRNWRLGECVVPPHFALVCLCALVLHSWKYPFFPTLAGVLWGRLAHLMYSLKRFFSFE